MSWQGLSAALRSRWGRAALVAVGVGAVVALIEHMGPAVILAALRRSASAFPLVFLLEGGMVACTMLGLRTLYGPDRHNLTVGDLTRAGLLGYVAMLLMPSGRTFAEATRATLLAHRSTPARAAFAAYQMQAACLLGNGVILLLATAAAWWVMGFNGYVLAILGNLAACVVVGLGMLFGSRLVKIGGLLGRFLPSVSDHGKAFDAHTREHPAVPWVPSLWELGGRVLQTVQMMILVAAVGGRLSALAGLICEGAHEVGAAVGGLIPGQIGAAEVNLAVFAKTLAIDSTGAVAVALDVHLAQLCWVLVGLGVALFSRPAKPPAETIDEVPSPALEVLR